MRVAGLVVAMAMMAGPPGCTLVAVGTMATTIATHNELADSADHWSYTTPLLISGAIGLAVDIFLVVYIGSEWNKPLT